MTFMKNIKSYLRPALFFVTIMAILGSLIIFIQGRNKANFDVQVSELTESFPEFLAQRLKKEKKDSKLLKVEIVSVDRGRDGLVNIAYSLLFDDLVSGQLTPSAVEATATLKNENEVWKVVKILTKKESIDFAD